VTLVNTFKCTRHLHRKVFLDDFYHKTQNIVRKMPLISLKVRGRAVGLINSWPPKQKTRSIFVFLFFYVFYSFLCTIRYNVQLNFTHFNCIRHVCLTDTISFSSNGGRCIWQPEVLPTLLNARNDES